VIDESDLPYDKQFDPRISTLRGIRIDWSHENENAADLIRVKCEFDSNLIDEIDSQPKKQPDPRISTFYGIKIIEVANMKICPIQFMLSASVIQTQST
jgi:hypothetical protein